MRLISLIEGEGVLLSLVGEEVWLGVQHELKKRMPESIFKQWFAEAEVMSFDGERFELGVHNRFYKSRIEAAYLKDLVASVASVAEREVEVVVSVSPRLLAAFRKTQENAKTAPLDVGISFAPLSGIDTHPVSGEGKRAGQKLNPNFTFATFVMGPANRLSYAVAQRAVENPGEYNPLFFFGQPGVGKTHLLQAICSDMRSRHAEWKVVYITADKFVADFSFASTSGRVGEFRDLYRKCDALVMDDLQNLGQGKKLASQAELLGIVDELTAHGKQVIFGAACEPGQLDGIDVKLRDRLGAGFVDQLLLPDEETRRELVMRKMALWGITLPNSAVAMLARELSGNVRKLEGTVKRLAALIKLKGMEPTTHCIRMALEVASTVRIKDAVTFQDIIAAAAEEFGVTPVALVGRGRTARLRQARQVAVALCRYLAGGRHAELGEVFGGRSHATIISTLKTLPPRLFDGGLEGRPVERILFRLGVTIKPEDLIKRQPGLFDR